MVGSVERDTLAHNIRRLDRSTEGAERRDLRSTKSRQIVETRSLRYASLREAPVEMTVQFLSAVSTEAPQARIGETLPKQKAFAE